VRRQSMFQITLNGEYNQAGCQSEETEKPHHSLTAMSVELVYHVSCWWGWLLRFWPHRPWSMEFGPRYSRNL